MMFMNQWEIENAVSKYANPIDRYSMSLHRGALLLQNFMQAVNRMSDGWAYWSPAPRAAKKLMELLERPPADEGDRLEVLRSAERTLKTFCAKHRTQGLDKDGIWAVVPEIRELAVSR